MGIGLDDELLKLSLLVVVSYNVRQKLTPL